MRSCIVPSTFNALSPQIVAVHTNDHGSWNLYCQLQEKQLLPIRVFLAPDFEELEHGCMPEPRETRGLLSCDRVKMFADGSLGAVWFCLADV